MSSVYYSLYCNREDKITVICDPFFVNMPDNTFMVTVVADFDILAKIIPLPDGWYKSHYPGNYWINCFPQEEAHKLMNSWAEKILELPEITEDLVRFGFCTSDRDIRWKFYVLNVKISKYPDNLWNVWLKKQYPEKTYEDYHKGEI